MKVYSKDCFLYFIEFSIGALTTIESRAELMKYTGSESTILFFYSTIGNVYFVQGESPEMMFLVKRGKVSKQTGKYR